MALGEAKEVKKARQHVREKETAQWDRVETAGRSARQAEAKDRQSAGQKEDGQKQEDVKKKKAVAKA